MNANAERILIGTLIERHETIDEAVEAGLTSTAFADPDLGAIYTRMLEWSLSGRSWGLQDVSALAPSPAAMVKAVECADSATIAQNLTVYAKEVMDAAWQRRAVRELTAMARAVASRAVFSSADELRALLDTKVTDLLTDEGGKFATPELPETVDRLLADMEDAATAAAEGRLRGYPTGFKALDRLTHGIRPGQLWVVGGRPGMGKTTLALNIMTRAAEAGATAAYFTVEMNDTDIATKLISSWAQVPSFQIMDAAFHSDDEEARFAQGYRQVLQLPVRINDRAGHTIETFEAECRRLHRAGKLDLVVMDYVQLMSVSSQFIPARSQEIALISRRLKQLALQLKIPVIALAQVNRESTKGTDKRPTMAHIKDSGALEQDADIILFVHRETYHGNDEGKDELIVAKNRRGMPGTIEVGVDLQNNRFYDLEPA